MKQECIQETNDRLIVFHDPRSKSKLTIINKDQLRTTKVKVDDCEIRTGIRCDHLLLSNSLEYFIELKGQDISHAIEQLGTSIKQLSQDPDIKLSFIICTRSPINSASIMNLKAKFRRKFGFKLIIKNSPFKYQLDQ